MTHIQGWAAQNSGQKLELISVELGTLGAEEVEITVEHCGICHSDLSMLNNDWGFSSYPLIAGHEVVGKISALGKDVKGLKIGQAVGVG